jgi:hypothetical protein
MPCSRSATSKQDGKKKKDAGKEPAHGGVPDTVRFRQMELRDVSRVFHIGEEGETWFHGHYAESLWADERPPAPFALPVFTSNKHIQLYRTWDAFEVTESLASEPELCLVAEDVSRRE